MPTVLIIAAPKPASTRGRIAGEVSAAIASALDLPQDAVYTAFLPPGTAFVGAAGVTPWPIALLHGRQRRPEWMRLAVAAVADILAREWQTDDEHVHVQWVIAA